MARFSQNLLTPKHCGLGECSKEDGYSALLGTLWGYTSTQLTDPGFHGRGVTWPMVATGKVLLRNNVDIRIPAIN